MAEFERDSAKRTNDAASLARGRRHDVGPRNREEIPQKDFIPRIGAGCLVAIGAGIALLGLTAIWNGAGVDGVLMRVLLGVAFAAGGVFWYNYVSRQERSRRELIEEKALLRVALNHGGRATIAQVALETPFTAAETEAIMERLCRQGLARPDILDDGTISYRFGGLIDQ